ncbi:MAG: helix-hairpin-helix domain-containing protein, partial [Gammaproteobacteria bacterium]
MNKLLIAVLVVTAPGLVFAGPVNINSADAETIAAELDGVGVSKAQAIVAYREQNGAFASPEEVLNVKGIG